MSTQFSIVIPVYNAATTLQDTLDSVARQSYRNFEVVVVDDGSTDGSAEIIRQWKKDTDFSVQLISQENKGLGAARNQGISAARHPWIALLDADDLWEKERLSKMDQFISQSSAQVYYHTVKSFGLKRPKVRRAYAVKSMEEMLTRGNPLFPSATVVQKKVLEKFPFTENRKHHGAEDLHLWLRLLSAGKSFGFLNQPLTLYRETGGMSTQLETHLSHVFHVLEDLHKQGGFDEDTLKTARKRKHLEAARFYQKRAEFRAADRHYTLALPTVFRYRILRLLNYLRLPL